MNVCFIGKHKYSKDIFSNEQDLKTWRSLIAYFDKLFVIVESPDLIFHFGKENNIRIYLLPRLGYLGFVFLSVVLGIYLNLKYGISVFDASEVAGGGIAATILKFLTGKLSAIEVQGEIFRKSGDFNNTNTRIYANDTNNIRGIRMRFVDSYYYKSLLLQKIGQFVMKRAARVRVISHAIFNQVREQGIPENKIRLVSLRVDLNLFNPLLIYEINSFGDKVGINIGYIGRLVEGKGLEDLLEAVKILKNQSLPARPNPPTDGAGGGLRAWSLVIYGIGPLKSKLEKLAKELKIADKIEWRGFVPYGKVPQALSQIDIFVYPSWHEGFGRSIMEALAMEKAVVTTNVGGIPDLINDGENGFLVEPHKPEELTEKLKILMKSKELREKFGKAGREWVSKNFEWNDGIKKFAQIFLNLKSSNTNNANKHE